MKYEAILSLLPTIHAGLYCNMLIPCISTSVNLVNQGVYFPNDGPNNVIEIQQKIERICMNIRYQVVGNQSMAHLNLVETTDNFIAGGHSGNE